MAPKTRPDRGRIYPFNYFVPQKEERELNADRRRDLGAVVELLPVLLRLGWTYGEPILNCPPRDLKRRLKDEDMEEPDLLVPNLPMDLSFLRRGDLVLQTTRPPLDDWAMRTKKMVLRGYTELEQILLEIWREYFPVCARSQVRLHPEFAPEMNEAFRNRRDMQFTQKTLAPYSRVGIANKERPKHRTAAFLLHRTEIWPGGPDLLGAFSMDGPTTQGWAFRLARDWAHLLAKPGFVVVEIEHCKLPERPLDLRWADDWKIDVILEHRP